MDVLEEQFTATTTKLLQHADVLLKMKRGHFHPITLELAPTNKCNLNCSFCSVANRDKDQEIKFDQLIPVLEEFRAMGLKSLEITGGGDPTMYPKINELIEWASESTHWKLGMITNGILLKQNVTKENLDKLQWLRISLNSLDQIDHVDVPKIKGTLGFSYVWNPEDHEGRNPVDTLNQLDYYRQRYNAKYVRIVPNCLTQKSQALFLDLTEIINDYAGFFAQTKSYGVPNRCWWGYLKPFLNADGYIYRCSACPLLERKFPEKFRMGRMKDARKIWEEAAPFDTNRCKAGKCFFAPQNDLIESVLQEVEHDAFI